MTTPPWGPPQPQPRRSKPGYGKIAGIGCAGITGLFIVSAVIAGIADSTKNTAATRPATTASTASADPTPSDSPSPSWTETYAPDSVIAKCRAQHWPQPMPKLAGKDFNVDGKALGCFEDIAALAPDGHDVMNDSGPDQQPWTIVSSSPKPGAMVRYDTHVSLRLRDPYAASTPASTPSSGGDSGSTTTSGGSSTSSGGTSDHGGATALCVDGTLSYSQHHSGTCSHHHGVAVWYR